MPLNIWGQRGQYKHAHTNRKKLKILIKFGDVGVRKSLGVS